MDCHKISGWVAIGCVKGAVGRWRARGQVQRLEMSAVEAWGGRLAFPGGTREAPGGDGA